MLKGFAMRKTILTLLAVSAAGLAAIADLQQVQARPGGGGSGGGGIGRAGGGWSGTRWTRVTHRGGLGFHRGRIAPLTTGSEPGRYLSETASFLEGNAGYLAGSEIYPDLMDGPFGYAYPVQAVPASYRPEPMATYVVPVHRSPSGARRVVRVFRGPISPIVRPPFAPGLMP
jgi:hypothetical protein